MPWPSFDIFVDSPLVHSPKKHQDSNLQLKSSTGVTFRCLGGVRRRLILWLSFLPPVTCDTRCSAVPLHGTLCEADGIARYDTAVATGGKRALVARRRCRRAAAASCPGPGWVRGLPASRPRLRRQHAGLVPTILLSVNVTDLLLSVSRTHLQQLYFQPALAL